MPQKCGFFFVVRARERKRLGQFFDIPDIPPLPPPLRKEGKSVLDLEKEGKSLLDWKRREKIAIIGFTFQTIYC